MSSLAVSAAAEAGDLRRVDDDVIGLLRRVGVRAGGHRALLWNGAVRGSLALEDVQRVLLALKIRGVAVDLLACVDGRGGERECVSVVVVGNLTHRVFFEYRTELLEVSSLPLGHLVLLAGLSPGGAAAPDGHRLGRLRPGLGEGHPRLGSACLRCVGTSARHNGQRRRRGSSMKLARGAARLSEEPNQPTRRGC